MCLDGDPIITVVYQCPDFTGKFCHTGRFLILSGISIKDHLTSAHWQVRVFELKSGIYNKLVLGEYGAHLKHLDNMQLCCEATDEILVKTEWFSVKWQKMSFF